MVHVINNNINRYNRVFQNCYNSGSIILELQYNMPPLKSLFHTNRITYFVEVSLFYLAQQVKLVKLNNTLHLRYLFQGLYALF